jgi:hypothetical protein
VALTPVFAAVERGRAGERERERRERKREKREFIRKVLLKYRLNQKTVFWNVFGLHRTPPAAYSDAVRM